MLGYKLDQAGFLAAFPYLLMAGIVQSAGVLGAKYLFFFSSRSLKTREKYTTFDQLVLFSLYIFLGKSAYFSIFE